MNEEKPNDTPREDKAPTKGTNKPWDRAGQQSQDSSLPDAPKPDLEKWQKSKIKDALTERETGAQPWNIETAAIASDHEAQPRKPIHAPIVRSMTAAMEARVTRLTTG